VQVTALVERADHVCVRYRLAAFMPALAAGGIALELVEFPKSLLTRLKLYQSLAASDAVVLQRTLLNRFELGVLRKHAKRLIFDFDDAVWRRDSYAKSPHSAKRRRRFDGMLGNVDMAFAGNAFLAERASRHCADVHVVPTCVEVGNNQWSDHPSPPTPLPQSRERGAGAGDALDMVWVGSSSTLRSLEVIRPALQALGRTMPHLRLKLICDRFTTFDHLPVNNVTWNETTESSEIASSHIGIAVMPDDDWSRGKCGLKVLQYMAAGLPVVANRVGVHDTMITPGVNGFLADTPEEWSTAITALQDASLRKRLGEAGRALVRKHYSIECGVALWLQSLRPAAWRVAC
jgi:glycosyltransferase involved in cell wall biosynthesis